MDNNILSSILSLLSSGNSSTPNESTEHFEQNPAYFGYPKEAYPKQKGFSLNQNLESVLPLLGKKGSFESILSNISNSNTPITSIASLLSNKKEGKSPQPDKEILL